LKIQEAYTTTIETNKATGKIPSLDGLRALSIILVLLGHLSGTRNLPRFKLERWLGDYANLGVVVFFVISGYLITSLLREERELTGGISLKQFYVRRAIRIFPAFFAMMGVLIALALGGWITLGSRDIGYALTYIVNYQVNPPWNTGHLWSLSVEEQFYLLWPWAVWWLGNRKAAWLAAGVIAVSPGMRILGWLLWRGTAIGDLAMFPMVADSLASGCLLGMLRGWLHEQKWYLRMLRGPWMAVMLVLLFACNASRVYTAGAVFGRTVINLLLAMMIDYCITNSDNLFGRVLNATPLVWIGTLSYSLYLWQQLFLNRHSTWPVCAFPINLMLALAVSTASYYALEKPLLRLRKRFAAVRV